MPDHASNQAMAASAKNFDKALTLVKAWCFLMPELCQARASSDAPVPAFSASAVGKGVTLNQRTAPPLACMTSKRKP